MVLRLTMKTGKNFKYEKCLNILNFVYFHKLYKKTALLKISVQTIEAENSKHQKWEKNCNFKNSTMQLKGSTYLLKYVRENIRHRYILLQAYAGHRRKSPPVLSKGKNEISKINRTRESEIFYKNGRFQHRGDLVKTGWGYLIFLLS